MGKKLLGTIIKNGDRYPRWSKCEDSDPKKVRVSHVTTTKDGQKVGLQTVIDLSNMDQKELYINAAMNVLIQKIRPKKFRKMTAEEVRNDFGKSYDPTDKDFLATRRASNPIDKLAKAAFGKKFDELNASQQAKIKKMAEMLSEE